MFDERDRTFLNLIVPDCQSAQERGNRLSALVDGLVDHIASQSGAEEVFRIRSLDDLASLSTDELMRTKSWEIAFHKEPCTASLCALLGEAIDRCKPRAIGVWAMQDDASTERLLTMLRTILVSLNRCPVGLRLVSCPTCARCRVNLIAYAREVQQSLRERSGNLVVAVMGCEVNGPGEARSSDVGIAFGRGAGLIFRKGENIRKVSADKAVQSLMDEVDLLLRVDESQNSDMSKGLGVQ